jgi:hypothetical protein
LFHQSIDEVRAEKARSPRDQNFHSDWLLERIGGMGRSEVAPGGPICQR